MACERFIGSSRRQEGGFLGTHKQDFETHRKGCDWRHEADHIDMNPIIPKFPGLNVQETLELMSLSIDGYIGLSKVLNVDNHAGTNSIVMDMQFIHELQNPIQPQDAATKWYIDQLLSVESWKNTLLKGNSSGGVDVNINGYSRVINSDPGGNFSVFLTDTPDGKGGDFIFSGADGYEGSSFLVYGGNSGNHLGGSVVLQGGNSATFYGGDVVLKSGNGAIAGGDILLKSGIGEGDFHIHGDIIFSNGADLYWPHNDGNPGDAIITNGIGELSFRKVGGETLGETLALGHTTDGITIDSTGSSAFVTKTDSGVLTMDSGYNNFTIASKNHDTAVTGSITIITGNSANYSAGNIYMLAGSSNAIDGGSVHIIAGGSSGGEGGTIKLFAAHGKTAGDVLISAGTSDPDTEDGSIFFGVEYGTITTAKLIRQNLVDGIFVIYGSDSESRYGYETV